MFGLDARGADVAALQGVHPSRRLGRTLAIAESLDAHPGEVVNFENRYMAKDGSWRWLLWSARSDEHRKYAVAREITDRKQLEQERQELLSRVEAMARTDALTGLPNRRSWEEEIRKEIARAQRHGHPLAVAIADLDRFKVFNDTHGHAAGDKLLVDLATSWRLTLRDVDLLAGHGGRAQRSRSMPLMCRTPRIRRTRRRGSARPPAQSLICWAR